MNKREMNLKIFAGEQVPRIFFQPRIEPWFWWHKTFNSLPKQYQDMNILDVYDDLGVSNRYFSHFTGILDPIETHFEACVHKKTDVIGDRKITVFQLP